MSDGKCPKCKSSDIKVDKIDLKKMPNGLIVSMHYIKCNTCLEATDLMFHKYESKYESMM